VKKLRRSGLRESTQYVNGFFYNFLTDHSFQRFSSTEDKLVEIDPETEGSILKDAFFHRFGLGSDSLDVFLTDSTIHFQGALSSDAVNINQNIFHQDLLSQTLQPLSLTRRGVQLPGIISNQDHTADGRFQLLFWQNGRAQTSAKWNFKRPDNCSYVGVVTDMGQDYLGFVCRRLSEVYLDLVTLED
jgi:hypothetical protein